MDDTTRMPIVRARIPAPLVSALEAAAAREGQNISEMMRDLLKEGLLRRGLWPPPPAAHAPPGTASA